MALGLPLFRLRQTPHWLFSSLKIKFLLGLILLVCLVMGGSTWWTLELHRQHMLEATEDKVRAVAEAIDRGIQVTMREGRPQDVQRLLEEFARDPDIDQIIIFDRQGKILRSSHPEMVGRVLDRDRLSHYLVQPDFTVTGVYEKGQLVRSVVKRILNRGECNQCHGTQSPVAGILHVDMSFRRTQEGIEEMGRSAVWAVLITALVMAIGGTLLMVRLVDRPVARLGKAMAQVEAGNLEVRASASARDELGRLADSFNTMVERLRAARSEIEAYHQERLDRAERLATLGALAASLAHEIKNPLAGIGGAIQVMADEFPADDPRKEIMHEILTQLRRLDKTVRDLLAFTRPGKPDVAPCQIHQVLDRVLLLLAQDPHAKHVRIVRDYRTDLPPTEADGKQMGQVFLNLLLNSVQAMPHGGQITLRTGVVEASGNGAGPPGVRGPVVKVEVSDTGPGIPAHILPNIFKPFVTTKHRGTGLGLSVSRRMIEDHGGWIEAESAPGQGATFQVFLPVSSQPSGMGAASAS